MARVELVWDSLSDNTGDRAVGTTIRRMVRRAGLDAVGTGGLVTGCESPDVAVLAGGELLHPPGHGFYDAFRRPGPHILCPAGVGGPTEAGFLADYRIVAVRSQGDRRKLAAVDREVQVAPCVTVLYDEIARGERSRGAESGGLGLQLNAASFAADDGPAVVETLGRLDRSPLVLLGFTHYNRDFELHEVLARHLEGARLVEADGPDGGFAAIRGLRAILTTSLHATIFAYISGIPFLAIPYSGKVSDFLAERGLQGRSLARIVDLPAKIDLLEPESVDWQAQLEADRSSSRELLQRIFDEVDDALSGPATARGGHGWRPPSHAAHCHRQMMEQFAAYGHYFASSVAARLQEARVQGYVRHLEADLGAMRRSLDEARTDCEQLQQELELARQEPPRGVRDRGGDDQ